MGAGDGTSGDGCIGCVSHHSRCSGPDAVGSARSTAVKGPGTHLG